MVLDPFSALGLAGNIIQFVDFGGKLLSHSAELYRSVDGALSFNKELEIITGDLRSLSANLAASSHSQSTALSGADNFPTELASSCKVLADELLSKLAKLRVRGTYKKWKSVRQAPCQCLEGEGDSKLQE